MNSSSGPFPPLHKQQPGGSLPPQEQHATQHGQYLPASSVAAHTATQFASALTPAMNQPLLGRSATGHACKQIQPHKPLLIIGFTCTVGALQPRRGLLLQPQASTRTRHIKYLPCNCRHRDGRLATPRCMDSRQACKGTTRPSMRRRCSMGCRLGTAPQGSSTRA